MKRIITLSVLALLGVSAYGQDAQSAAAAAAAAINNAPKAKAAPVKANYWKTSATFDLGFNQTGLWNWAAGGYNTLNLAAAIDGKADYQKDMMSWNNRIQLNYGFLWSADKKELIQKSNDRIYLESKWAYMTAKESKWNYTASFDFRTQFSNSFDNYQQVNNKWVGDLKSGFLAPAYTNLALGLEWKPNNWFNCNIAPLTGGFTIVTIEGLRPQYGLKMKEDGSAYKSTLFQFGAQVKANAKATINDKFTYETQLVFFYDYINRVKTGRFPIRVNWDNTINWTISKLFKVGFSTWLIYDPNIEFKTADPNVTTDKVQFKEFLSINFTYTIAGKK